MRFGIATFVTDRGISPAPLAKAIEERGFYSLFVAEHSHMPLAFEEPYPGAGELPRQLLRTLDPFVTLTSAAAATHSLKLATGVVLLAQRDLIYTAKEVATLDLISGGRVILGVGVGWNRHEMRNHRLDPMTRGAKMNEQLRALKQLWENDTAEFDGNFVNFTPLELTPKPIQRPRPPIYVGGSSMAALKRVQSLGDGWLPLGGGWLPLGGVAPKKIVWARQLLADNGRPDVPITICGAAADKATLSAYADVGVDEVALQLPTLPESATLRQLDELASLAQFSTVRPAR